MLLGYSDETYDEISYWFAVAMVPERADGDLQRKVTNIPSRFRHHGVPADAELHGYDLFHSGGAWEALGDWPLLRIHAYKLGLRALAETHPYIALVGVNRKGIKLADARAAAVEKLLVCVENECAFISERALLIFDEERSSTRALAATVRKHHRSRLATGLDPYIVQEPLIVESHHDPGVQVADLVAFLHLRRSARRHVNPREAAANEKLWSLVAPFIGCIVAP